MINIITETGNQLCGTKAGDSGTVTTLVALSFPASYEVVSCLATYPSNDSCSDDRGRLIALPDAPAQNIGNTFYGAECAGC